MIIYCEYDEVCILKFHPKSYRALISILQAQQKVFFLMLSSQKLF